ncbi:MULTISPECIES: IucA/IucC family C-terminal-domain containing protein [Halobacillus]|uniref:IucA/IucC family C-terminal-domain containing protein n=1 Tax=Halobacillus TaxID=45667 RepID=UPI00136FE512|nr:MULTISPECIES: IucA/IucC family C-terminal-domain containing protein [Halobacillus]MYL31634.1 hypothetical protein [Halobacillus halophilus]MYL39979.1 hypothetical protein [Halobacillus litoralis]
MNSIPSLLEETACIEFLQHQQKRICAPNIKVTASMMMKKYAQVLPSHVLNSMLWEEKSKIIPISACTISEKLDVQVKTEQIIYVDSRHEAWKELFSQHLFPLLQSFHKRTNLPAFILWENIAVRINSFFRKALEKYPEHQQTIIQLAKELNQLDGSYFNCDTHPMKTYLVDPNSLGEHKIRRTCCYFHKLDKKKESLTHCLVCPLQSSNGCS